VASGRRHAAATITSPRQKISTSCVLRYNGWLVSGQSMDHDAEAAQLRREGFQVNRKHVQRLMQELGVQGHRSAKKHRTTNSEHSFPRSPNLVEQLEVVRPDQVWVCDITYIQLRVECVYLAVLMDVFTRCIRGWHLGRSLDQSLTLRALSRHWRTRHQRSIMLIKGCSMRQLPRPPACSKQGSRSVWPR
jgi:transposase InsO family protein